ncbi:hypothetical protein AGMMS49975_28600 [Clostridia bacterium]|nr:hypothetical protein AGMMS49975_28600 [Clostridia bacterium]
MFPYLRNANVKWGDFDLDNLLQMRFEKSEVERYSICNGDLVICEGGEPGRCAVWESEQTAFIQKALHRVRPYANINTKYICFVMRHYAQSNLLNEYFTGSTIKHLTGQSLSVILFPLPPLAEQHRIVDAIKSAFAVIDEIERNKSDLQAAVTSAKQKILSLAMSGKLVPQDENDEPAEELLKRIKSERDKLIKAGKIKADKREKDWAITRDNSHYEKLPLIAVCRLFNTAESANGTLPYLEVRYLRTQSSPDYKQSGRYIESGTAVILVDGENSGEVFNVCENGYMGSTFRELLISKEYDERFVLLFIKHYQHELRESKTGSAIPHLNKKMFAELPIPLISIETQRRIVGVVNSQFAILDEISSNI